jgi:hypothetical protein
MKFIAEIKLDNAAYDNQYIQYELIDNLKGIIAKLENANEWGTIKDSNGNTVGKWDIEID